MGARVGLALDDWAFILYRGAEPSPLNEPKYA